MKTVTITLILLFSLVSCAQEESTGAVAATTEKVETGNKFKDAAINKVKQANPGFSVQQATCVIEALTKDAVYGLGEINQMNLGADAARQNSSQLFQAYQDAVKGCK